MKGVSREESRAMRGRGSPRSQLGPPSVRRTGPVSRSIVRLLAIANQGPALPQTRESPTLLRSLPPGAGVAGGCGRFFHTPSNLVVIYWTSDVESAAHLDFLW